jgi:hypothetical protein
MPACRCLSPSDGRPSSPARRKSTRRSTPGRQSRRVANRSDRVRGANRLRTGSLGETCCGGAASGDGGERKGTSTNQVSLGKELGTNLFCTVGHHESHSRLQLIVFPSWPQSVLDNHLLFSQRGFVDGVTARTGSRQSTRNDSLPSNAAVSDDLLRKRPKSQRMTLARVALPSSCAIMSILCHDRCKVGCHASRSSRGQPAFRIGARLVASSTAIMSMHLRQHMQGRMPHITFISRPARIPRSSRPQAV